MSLVKQFWEHEGFGRVWQRHLTNRQTYTAGRTFVLQHAKHVLNPLTPPPPPPPPFWLQGVSNHGAGAVPRDKQVIISSARGTASGRSWATPSGALSAMAAATLATSLALPVPTSPPAMTAISMRTTMTKTDMDDVGIDGGSSDSDDMTISNVIVIIIATISNQVPMPA